MTNDDNMWHRFVSGLGWLDRLSALYDHSIYMRATGENVEDSEPLFVQYVFLNLFGNPSIKDDS